MLLTHSEDAVTMWFESVEHIIKAALWEEVGAEATRASDDVKGATVARRQALLAHYESLNTLIDSLALQAEFLGL